VAPPPPTRADNAPPEDPAEAAAAGVLELEMALKEMEVRRNSPWHAPWGKC
jgi:hypothetical protein